jgi:hypothetical protein
MDNPAAAAGSLNIEQLLQLHSLTKDVSKFCQKQLRGYLETLALLFRPRRTLGEAIDCGGTAGVVSSCGAAPL